MNRTEEYRALLADLEPTPAALDTVVARAAARKKAAQRKRRLFGIPVGSLAACFAGFVLLVNLFPPFAAACGNLPVLRELAKAVAWSPSLSAAVENAYVQPMGQTQTKNGVTATVEYVIVDRKQVSIFYTMTTQNDTPLLGDCAISLPDGGDGYSTSWSDFGLENGELQRMDVNFVDRDVPDRLTMTLEVCAAPTGPADDAPAPPEVDFGDEMLTDSTEPERSCLAKFAFDLTFDPAYTDQGAVIAVDRTFQLDGQAVTVTEAELYPTHLRLNLSYDEANTAWLTGLDFYLENEHGERFDPATNGITASGDSAGTPAMCTFWLDSPWFRQGDRLTLCITGAQWLDKDRERVLVDLTDGSCDGLPDGVRIEWTEKRDGGWLLSSSAPYQWQDETIRQIWKGTYYDLAGGERSIDQRNGSNTPVALGSLSGRDLESYDAYAAANTDRYFDTFGLKGYTADTVWLCPGWTRVTTHDTPVEVVIR